MMADEIDSGLEPIARHFVDWNTVAHNDNPMVGIALSQAISMKRIADALERLAEVLVNPVVAASPVKDVVTYIEILGGQPDAGIKVYHRGGFVGEIGVVGSDHVLGERRWSFTGRHGHPSLSAQSLENLKSKLESYLDAKA